MSRLWELVIFAFLATLALNMLAAAVTPLLPALGVFALIYLGFNIWRHYSRRW